MNRQVRGGKGRSFFEKKCSYINWKKHQGHLMEKFDLHDKAFGGDQKKRSGRENLKDRERDLSRLH